MKKVLVLVPFSMSEENRQRRRAQLQAVELGPGISFDFESVRIAPRNYVSAADMVLADMGVLEAGLDAERRGYHAVCIDTMSDSGVAALRSELTIPVIGPGRASILTAMILGSRFSIVAMWPHWRHLYDKTLRELGVAHACASVRSINVTPDNQALMTGKEAELFPLLEDCTRSCIERDGADVILLGSTTMHEAHGHLAARLPVPVVNPGPLTYKLAEAVLGLGMTHSRRAFPPSPAPQHQLIRRLGHAAGKTAAGG